MGDSVFVPLREPNRSFVEEQTRELGFADEARYVESLIEQQRKASEKNRAVKKLKALIEEGMESGPAKPFEPKFFDRMRRQYQG